MPYNYDVKPIQFADAVKTFVGNRDEANVRKLTEAYLSGDENAIRELAAIDRQAAAQAMSLKEGMKPKKPAPIDVPKLSGSLQSISDSYASGSSLAPVLLSNLVAQFEGTKIGSSLSALQQGMQEDPEEAFLNFDKIIKGLNGPQKIDVEFNKEERKFANASLSNFNKQVSDIRGGYGKIESLLSKKTLSRADIASSMTLLARLLSPGIVTDRDFSNLGQGVDPVAFAFDRMRGAGMDEESINDLNRFYDPSNPDLFDKAGFLDTTKRVTSAGLPALLDIYEDAKTRASKNIKTKRVDTIFGDNKNYQFAKGFIGRKETPVTSYAAPDGEIIDITDIEFTAKSNGITPEQVIKQLNLKAQ